MNSCFTNIVVLCWQIIHTFSVFCIICCDCSKTFRMG
nr:MAG TPA: hypothetical protein [Caudoviricetes sp.]